MLISLDKAERLVSDTLANGGATVSVNGGQVPTDGYFVSDPGQTFVTRDMLSANVVIQFAARHAEALNEANAYLGTWLSDGIVYLDVTRHYSHEETAMVAGQLNGQLAIYDVANGRDVSVYEREVA